MICRCGLTSGDRPLVWRRDGAIAVKECARDFVCFLSVRERQMERRRGRELWISNYERGDGGKCARTGNCRERGFKVGKRSLAGMFLPRSGHPS